MRGGEVIFAHSNFCVTLYVLLYNMKILKTDHLLLRPVTLSDAPIFLRWFKDREVTEFLDRFRAGKKIPSLAEEKAWIRSVSKNKHEPVWSIINQEGMVIGNTTIRIAPESKLANFGLVIGEKSEWGKGYAGEVLSALLTYAFVTLKLNRFELTVDAANKRAIRAYEKSGFIKEGCLRQHTYDKRTKKFGDVNMMSVLREDWIKRK